MFHNLFSFSLFCQVFDWESFAALVQYHCLEPKNFDSDFEERILSSTSVYFSFVKDGEDDVNTPCWAQLDVLSAFNQAKGNTSCFTLKILNHRRFSKSVTRKGIVQFFHKAERELHKLHGNEGKVTYIQAGERNANN